MSSNIKNSTAAIKAACAIVFLTFTFCYVYFYQTDILALSQHVWSAGETHYSAGIGAIIITFVLYIVHLGLSAFVKLPSRAFALTFAPSLVLLGCLTSANLSADGTMSVGVFALIASVILVIIGFLMYALTDLTAMDKPTKNDGSLLSQVAWCNYGILVVMMFVTFAFGNNNRRLHSYLEIERNVMEKQYDDALDVDVSETDSSMTFFRAYALSKLGQLGERLFEYPLCGGSKILLPSSKSNVKLLIMPDSLVWHHIGAAPCKPIINVAMFCTILQKQHLAHPCVDDYLLTSYLLDKNLRGFAREIVKYYDFRSDEEKKTAQEKLEKARKKLARVIGEEAANDSLKEVVILTPTGGNMKPLSELPKHYREALVLYTRIHSQRVLTYTNEAMDADYDDYLKLERTKFPTRTEHDAALKDAYFGTYWWYYAKGSK